MASRRNTAPTDGGRFVRKETVSVPDFQFEEDEATYVKVMTAFVQAKPREQDAHDGRTGRIESTPMSPPIKARLVLLDTGELVSAIIPAMVRNQLEEAYPGEAYVGRCFEIVVHPARKPKKYKTADIFEIDPESGGETEVSAAE